MCCRAPSKRAIPTMIPTCGYRRSNSTLVKDIVDIGLVSAGRSCCAYGMREPTPETEIGRTGLRRLLAPLYVLVHHAAPRHQRPSSTPCVSVSHSPYAAGPMLVQAFRTIGSPMVSEWMTRSDAHWSLMACSKATACAASSINSPSIESSIIPRTSLSTSSSQPSSCTTNPGASEVCFQPELLAPHAPAADPIRLGPP